MIDRFAVAENRIYELENLMLLVVGKLSHPLCDSCPFVVGFFCYVDRLADGSPTFLPGITSHPRILVGVHFCFDIPHWNTGRMIESDVDELNLQFEETEAEGSNATPLVGRSEDEYRVISIEMLAVMCVLKEQGVEDAVQRKRLG